MPGPGPYGNKKEEAMKQRKRRQAIASRVARRFSRTDPRVLSGSLTKAKSRARAKAEILDYGKGWRSPDGTPFRKEIKQYRKLAKRNERQAELGKYGDSYGYRPR